jgi:hypothetical protein
MTVTVTGNVTVTSHGPAARSESAPAAGPTVRDSGSRSSGGGGQPASEGAAAGPAGTSGGGTGGNIAAWARAGTWTRH